VLVCALTRVKLVPAVSVVADLLPSSPIIMSFAFEVDTCPVVVIGPPLVPVFVYGRPVWVSKGALVYAPDMPNATAEIPFVASPELKVTVSESEPPALKSAHHSEIR